MTAISTLIFDLDGTLYVSKGLAAEIHGVAVLSIAEYLGIGTVEAESRLREAKARLTERTGWEATLSDSCRELGYSIQMLHRDFAEKVVPEPFLTRDERVIHLLARLGEKYRLYLYTNNNQLLATRTLAALGIGEYFSKVFSIEDFWRAKPDQEVLQMILDAVGVVPEECLFVGDRYDVDLRVPEGLGSTVFLTSTVDELLTIETYLHERQTLQMKETHNDRRSEESSGNGSSCPAG